jgi:metallophosphoesterase superfamily enzyme
MKKRNTFFKQVDKQVDRFINEYSIGQIILAGDYNDILSKIETKKIYILYSLINLSTCLSTCLKKVFLFFILLGA